MKAYSGKVLRFIALRGPSILTGSALFFSFIPILFPLTISLSVLGIAGAVFLLLRHARPGTGHLDVLRVAIRRSSATPPYASGLPWNVHSARALRLGLLALVVNAVLYAILGAHSWLFYIGAFDRELEPLRRIFQQVAIEKKK